MQSNPHTNGRGGGAAGRPPRQLSFAAAVQTVNAFAPALAAAAAAKPALLDILLRNIAGHRVGDRPDRYQPRAVKRRVKVIALLMVPRQQARKRLAKSGGAKC